MTDTFSARQVDGGDLVGGEENSVFAVVRCRPDGETLTAEGLRGLGPTAITLAGMEGLDAHGYAVQVRLDALAKGAA